MGWGSGENPRFVEVVLNWRWTGVLARVALVSAYLFGAAVKVSHWSDAVAEQAHFGLNPPSVWAAVTIGVEIVGPLLIVTNRWIWLGAGMLGVFTALAAITANPFWTMQGAARFTAANAFFDHLGLVGGFGLVALASRSGGVRRLSCCP